MTKAWKLIDAITVPVGFIAWITGDHGTPRQMRGRAVPGREYYDYIDDPVFISSITELHQRFDYSEALEQAVKDCGARYTLPKRTCKCQTQKIDIWYLEVLEE